MGMSPEVVDRTSFWQFLAAWNGYVAANTPDNGKLTASEADALFEWIDTPPANTNVPPMPKFSWNGNTLALRLSAV